ncbi:MAG: hypothetical protein AAF219_05545 [Myxococcota bacterium]
MFRRLFHRWTIGSPYTKHSVLANSVRQLSAMEDVDKRLTDSIHAAWKESYRAEAEDFFRELYRTLFNIADRYDGSKRETGALLLNYLRAAASNKYTGYNVAHLEPVFSEFSPRLIHLIERLLQYDNERLISPTGVSRCGDVGEIIERVFHLYFYHLTYPKLDCRGDALHLVRPYYEKYGDRSSNLVVNLLSHDVIGIADMAKLVAHAAAQLGSGDRLNAGTSILHDMLSQHANREDFTHKHAPEILSHLFDERPRWSNVELSWLIQHLFLEPLGIAEGRTADSERQNIQRSLTWAKRYPERRAEYEAKLLQIEDNFDAYLDDQLAAAAVCVRKSEVRLRCANAVLNRFEGSAALTPLCLLMDAVRSGKAPCRVYALDQSPSVPFSDYGFKLMVIEELMYRRRELKPEFDLRRFAREYEARDISVEDDGHDVIPEVEHYFKSLDIPHTLLQGVTELTLDDGCGGGMHVVTQYHPFWDPGCGDEVILPTRSMLEDLKHLPNLTQITFIGTEPAGEGLKAGLAAAGISYVFDAF